MNKPLISLNNLKKVFLTDEIETHAINDLSLRINQGEYVSISGPSGCGKSTLLSILGLLDVASDGSYQLSDHDVLGLSKSERAAIRNKEIGFVFQSFNLISNLSVEENVALPLTYRTDIDTATKDKWVKEALEQVDMSHRAKHFPAQLSGGQQQRVAIARAVAGQPSIILADEPTGNLDSKNAEAVMELLDKLHKNGATICIVTHDPRSAEQAQRKIEMYDGRVVNDTVIEFSKESAA